MVTTTLARDRKAAIKKLAEIGGKLVSEDDIVFQGRQLVVPETMTLTELHRFIGRKIDEDSEITRWFREYDYAPWDGAVCAFNAIRRCFGMVSVTGAFNGASFIDIPIDAYGNTLSVPWGNLIIPGLDDVRFALDSSYGEFGQKFIISAKGPRSRRFEVQGVFEIVREELEVNSIYRGKAFDQAMRFLPLDGVDRSKVVYSGDAHDQLQANLWSLLQYTDRMVARGLPLKRTVVLEGPYGTGKTLAAYLTAKVAAENGWTFVLCRPGQDLHGTLELAKMYQPAVVFAEDIDTFASTEERSINHVLDTMDGLTSKSSKVICVMTTNHIEALHKGVLRAGRIDAIVHIGELDAEGVRQLVTVTAGDHLEDDIDWGEVCNAMSGWLPCFVKEAVDRATRFALSRTSGLDDQLSTYDLVHSARGLQRHLDLMNEASEGQKPPALEAAMTEIVQHALDAVPLIDNYGDEMATLNTRNGSH